MGWFRENSSMVDSRRTLRRHPSAGNLSSRPALVAPDDPPVTLPPPSFPHGADTGPARVRLGPDLDDESPIKLLGPLEGRRILDLGCGSGSSSVAMAVAGARVIAVDGSTARLTRARHAAELAEVRVEFHHGDLADLAFIRADSIDSVLASYSLAGVSDLSRVFRQVHRVLQPEGAFVLSVPHPMSLMVDWDPEIGPTPWLSRSAWDTDSTTWVVAGDEGHAQILQISSLFTTLHRSNFRVDVVAEPRPEVPTEESTSPHRDAIHDWVPPTLVMRARKLGI